MKTDTKSVHSLPIDEKEIHFIYTRAPGPGGQHVNKVSTAVQLRFDVDKSPTLSDFLRQRLRVLAGNRITNKGILIINASRFRSQEKNRRDAIKRLAELIERASHITKSRRTTKPTKSSRKKRLASKKMRSKLKQSRRSVQRSVE